MADPFLGFVHRFVPATPAGPAAWLLLLHGTGGDEADLLPLGEAVAPDAALLSPRGKVLENGMPRFFRRHAEGVLDAEDLRARALELAGFVAAARARYGLERAPPPVALGFSNGANVAAAMLLLAPGSLAGAALLRPMALPLEPEPSLDLAGRPVLVLAGGADAIVPPGDPERLAARLRAAGAAVTLATEPGAGHGLTSAEPPRLRAWLQGIAAGST